ncbi:MAG: hypothetical protein HS116_19575 [Planctomycetes bacterium]|nr:hypothetical protein [Planctomycetota bacterium]
MDADRSAADLAARRSRLARGLGLVLGITVADTLYLSWRFTALFAGWATPGSGLCSWTPGIDCDAVLRTPEARAFVVPNAILGLAFYSGCAIWWRAGLRLGPAYEHHVLRTLSVWLGIASVFTFYFWKLLLGLAWLCPFCPWNHVWTYAACFLAWRLWRLTPRPEPGAPAGPLLKLVALCVSWFWIWVGAWFWFEAARRSSGGL